MYNRHPSPPSLPPLPPSLSPSIPPSPPLPSPPFPSPPLPPFLPSLPLVTQRFHCPFQPKQSPSSSFLLNTFPYQFNLLSCTFLDISLTFAVPRIISLFYSVQLGDSIHLSRNPHFCHVQRRPLCFLHYPCISTVHHRYSYNSIVHFPLTLELILRSHKTPDTWRAWLLSAIDCGYVWDIDSSELNSVNNTLIKQRCMGSDVFNLLSDKE